MAASPSPKYDSENMSCKYFFIFLFFISGACREQDSNTINCPRINIPLKEDENILNLSEIVDSLSYIGLETSSECLIGKIDKLITWKNRLVIADKTKAHAIFVFSEQGEFILKIDKVGRGPGEFVTLTDFTISAEGDIIIFDGSQRKLIIYSSEGKLIKELTLNFNAESVVFLTNNVVAFYCDFIHNHQLIKNSQYPNLIVYDLNIEKILNADLYFDQNILRQETVGFVNNFSSLKDGTATLLIPMDNTLYRVFSNDTVSRYYYLNYGEQTKNAQQAYKERIINHTVSVVDADREFASANYAILLNYIVCNHIIYSYYKKGDYYYYGFYYPNQKIYKESCVKNKSMSSFRLPIKNDIDHLSLFMPMATDGDYLYYVLEPYLLKRTGTSSINKELEHLREKISAEDNPLIICARIKPSIR